MDWEEKVQNQLEVIDEKIDDIERKVSKTVEKGIELSEQPAVEIPTAVLSMTAGTAMTVLGRKGMSKDNTIGKNIVAGAAVVVGSATVALSAAKLAVNFIKVRKNMEAKKVAKEIDKLIEEQ